MFLRHLLLLLVQVHVDFRLLVHPGPHELVQRLRRVVCQAVLHRCTHHGRVESFAELGVRVFRVLFLL